MLPRAPSSKVIPASLMLLILVTSTAVIAADPLPIGPPNPAVLDPALAEVLETAPGDQVLTIIVQYREDVERGDVRLLEDLGMEHVGTYTIIPAAVAKAFAQWAAGKGK